MTKSRGIQSRRRWTDAEVELMRLHYPDTPSPILAEALGRPVHQVHSKAYDMQLKKRPGLQSEMQRANIANPTHGGRRTAFAKGHAPFNKGIKRPPGWAPGRMAEGQFKPGHKPHTELPVGSYRVNADGVFERKVSDVSGPAHLRWKPVARLVWEAQVGPVPDGMLVTFKEGRRPKDVADLTAYTPDRLEVIDRAESMRRNSFRRYGPEIAKLVQLRGVLTRTINRRTEEEETT